MQLLRRPSLATSGVLGYLAAIVIYITIIGPTFLYRDPGSYFYNAAKAYRPGYSSVRKQQALDYVRSAASTAPVKAGAHPEVCVAMATTARKGPQYFDEAVGSLLEGLTPAERGALHVVLFVAHLDAAEHPLGAAPWLAALADTQLRYQDLPAAEFDEVAALVRGVGDERTRLKSRKDYVMMLEACQRTGAAQVLVVEDDVIAARGWLRRFREAVAAASRREQSEHLYIRLFHSSKLLGWNSEEWPTYQRNILLAIGVQLIALAAAYLPCASRRSPAPEHDATLALPLDESSRPHPVPHPVSSRLSFLRSFLLLAFANATIIPLIFLTGRLNVFPLARPITLMNQYGCCSQGLAFPAARVPTVLAYLAEQAARERGGAPGLWVDQTIEHYAMATGETRWAMVPAVLQHVGVKSATKEHEEVRTGGLGHRTFNYGFELLGEGGL